MSATESDDTESDKLAFDDVVIDFAGRRLLRGGSEQSLEPKAFAVLALLAGTPGRVFTRDEILDAVWVHRHVTPGVLNRIVTLLRQSLAEDAQHPRLLHTVYGVGYRFDVPRTDTPSDEVCDAGPVDAPIAGTEEPQPAAPIDTGPRLRRRRRRMAIVAGVLGLFAVAVAGALRTDPSTADAKLEPGAARQQPHEAEPATPTLIVMPLKSIGGDEGSRVIAEGLSEELICSLARIEGLRVIAHASTVVATAGGNDPVGLVRRLGITHSLEGNLQQAGQALRVRLRLVDTGSGGTVWVKDFDREVSEILGLQREVAREVAASLALRMGLDPEAAVRSGDAEFVRRTMDARLLLANGDSSTVSRALVESEFRALVHERPDDVRARNGLALTLLAHSTHSPEAAGLLDEAVGEALIARRFDPTQAESYSVEAYVACVRNDWERCLALKDKARAMAPSNAYVVGAYIKSLVQLGYFDRAEALARELSARDPLAGAAHLGLGRILDTQGRHEDARIELEQVGAEGSRARWFNAVWRGDLAQAQRIAEGEIAQDPSPMTASFAAVSRALLDPAQWPLAMAEFERSERDGSPWNFLRVLAPDAELDAARIVRELQNVRSEGPANWGLLLWTREFAWLRRDPAFQDYLRNTGMLAYWRAHGFPVHCRPEGDGARCD